MTKHDHSASDECTEACPAFDASSWACPLCERHRPMMADSEDWEEPVCDECYGIVMDGVEP